MQGPKTLQFCIGDRLLRFGLKQFVIVSGLKVIGNLEMPTFKERHHRRMRTYFPHNTAIIKLYLIEVIKVQHWNNVEDTIKLVILYMIQNFINTTKAEMKITKNAFVFVNSKKYVEYLCGLVSSRLLSASLKGSQT